MASKTSLWLLGTLLLASVATWPAFGAERFEGRYFSGQGDVEYLQLLDISKRMFEPDPEFQNLSMLYMPPPWNGFVEGPSWGAWWIQNSYGPTYCALPMLEEPYLTFLQNSQDCWFDQMGNNQREGHAPWVGGVAPDGCLCDCASPWGIVYKQGDGRNYLHDWCMEFTAAGLVLQSELLLISRDSEAVAHYLPKLERVANFIETRRDPKNNLFLAGPAGNLLAPSYAGWKKPDGTFGKAYLAGLSITYLAGLDRLIELEKLAGRADKVQLYTERRDLARKGLPQLTTEEGYFIKSLDPDGTKHGVYGAEKYGYFEAVCNHDAICFRIADDAQSQKIYEKIVSIPGLRPHDLIITNYPSLDDMYVPASAPGWEFGRWVNGGHWSTCEARMIMGYYRLGKQEDARRSMKRILGFARQFRMDNPLVKFGSEVYQPEFPTNLCYDTLGVPAAMIRGLFEYLYQADRLVILPHIPPGITELRQRFPIRFGSNKLFLSTIGSGPMTGVLVNGKPWKLFDAKSISLVYRDTPAEANIQILLGGAAPRSQEPIKPDAVIPEVPQGSTAWEDRLFPVISTNDMPLRIGANTRPEAGNRFVGDLARPQVFRRALSAAEIAELAEGKTAELDKDRALVGLWTFEGRRDDCFPNTADEQLPAKIVGKVQVVDSPHGKAIRLDGSGYLEVPHQERLNLDTGCTMAAWIRPSKIDSVVRIIDKCDIYAAKTGYMLELFPANRLRINVERGNLAATVEVQDQQWYHVAATVSGDGSLALYAQGKRIGERNDLSWKLTTLITRAARLRKLYERLRAENLSDSYEAAHARLAVQYLATCYQRMALLDQGKLPRLTPRSQYAADKSYFQTAARLGNGLEHVLNAYADSADPHKKQMYQIWAETKVTVHAPGRSEGGGWPAKWAWTAMVR